MEEKRAVQTQSSKAEMYGKTSDGTASVKSFTTYMADMMPNSSPSETQSKQRSNSCSVNSVASEDPALAATSFDKADAAPAITATSRPGSRART